MTESTTIAVTAYTDSTPNLTAVNNAIDLVQNESPITGLAVPGGGSGSEADKKAAVKAYLESLPGMGDLGVVISVNWNTETQSYDVTILKGSTILSTKVTVSGYTDSTPDQTAVDNAIDLVDGEDPIATIAVQGGAGGTEEDKEAAVKAYLEALHGMPEQGVTITVAWNAGNNNYDVTIKKG